MRQMNLKRHLFLIFTVIIGCTLFLVSDFSYSGLIDPYEQQPANTGGGENGFTQSELNSAFGPVNKPDASGKDNPDAGVFGGIKNILINKGDMLTWLIAFVTLLVAIPASFVLDKSLHRTFPGVQPYKWGYFMGVGGVISSLIYGVLLLASIHNAKVGEERTTLFVLLAYALIIAVTHFLIIKRQRWAWVTGTILQFNPLLWVLNTIYIRSRWAELSSNASAATDSQCVVDNSIAASRDNYKEAWDELERGDFDKGTWAQAFAEAEGNEEKAKAAYLKTRSQELSRQGEEQIAAQEREKCPYCGARVDMTAALCSSCGKILPDRHTR